MSQANELQARTDAFADLSLKFVEGPVFWLKRLLNANIRSTTADLEPLLAEAEQLARIFGSSHRTQDVATSATGANDQMMIRWLTDPTIQSILKSSIIDKSIPQHSRRERCWGTCRIR